MKNKVNHIQAINLFKFNKFIIYTTRRMKFKNEAESRKTGS